MSGKRLWVAAFVAALLLGSAPAAAAPASGQAVDVHGTLSTLPDSSPGADPYVVTTGFGVIPVAPSAALGTRTIGSPVVAQVVDGRAISVTPDSSSHAKPFAAPAAGTTASTAAATPTNVKVVVVPVSWTDHATDLTGPQLQTLVGPGLADFYDSTTAGQISVTTTGTPTRVYGTKAPTTCDGYFAVASDVADWATSNGYLAAGDHLAIYWANDPVCYWAGLGNLRGYTMWLNGQTSLVYVLAHELGHNLGLNHSSHLVCDDGTGLIPWRADFTNTCSKIEYGSPYSIMAATMAEFPAHQAQQLGVLPDTAVANITGRSQTLTLSPRALHTTGIQGAWLRSDEVTASETTPIAYWIEFRTSAGLDSVLGPAVCDPDGSGPLPEQGVYVPGVVVSLVNLNSEQEYVLETGASSRGECSEDFALQAGESLEVPGHFSVTVNSLSGSSANVTITQPADTAPPAVDAPYVYYFEGWIVGGIAATDDRGIAGYDVILDGTQVATDLSPETTLWPLPSDPAPGTHTVAVRAWDNAGNSTLSEQSTFQVGPPLLFKPGYPRTSITAGRTVSSTQIPVRVGWLYEGTACAAYVGTWQGAPAGPTTVLQKPGTKRAWTVALDPCFQYANDVQVRRATPARTAGLLAPAATALRGTWTTQKSSSAIAGSEKVTRARGASYTYTRIWKSGDSFALVARKAPTRGRATVYVDGVKAAVIDLRSSFTTRPMTLFSRTFTAGRHTVKIVNQATAGRPWVAVDAVAVLVS